MSTPTGTSGHAPVVQEESSARAKKRNMDTPSVTSDVSLLVLTTLKDASAFIPVPYLQNSAALALTILQTIQTVRGNKGAFISLATDACDLVYVVISTQRGMDDKGTTANSKLSDNLQGLTKTLADIEYFTRKEAARNVFYRWISHNSDIGKIQEYRSKLRHSLEVFTLQSDIEIREVVARIAARQEELAVESRRREGGSVGVERETMQHKLASPSAQSVPGGLGSSTQFRGGKRTITTVGGDQTISNTSNRTSNVNSGNTTTRTTTNSDNDKSTRIGIGSQLKQYFRSTDRRR